VRPTGLKSKVPASLHQSAWVSPAPGDGCRHEEVVGVRLRGGNANTGRGWPAFSPRCSNRVRRAGRPGRWCWRADSGFYSSKVTQACAKGGGELLGHGQDLQGIAQGDRSHPGGGLTPIPYWIDDGARRGRDDLPPFSPKHPEVRLIVRRVKPTPGASWRLFSNLRTTTRFITDREGETIYLEADHRRHAVVEDVDRDLKVRVGVNHLPSGRFAPMPSGMTLNVHRPQSRPLGGSHRLGREATSIYHQDLRTADVEPARAHDHIWCQKDPAPAEGMAVGRTSSTRS